MTRKKKGVQKSTTAAEPMAIEETTSSNSQQASLKEIVTYDGVIGYILRNSTSATIDIKDPSKIIDYAILSSSAFDASAKLLKLFDLGNNRNIVIEGNDIKMLCLTVDENKISIFMEKNADCEKVLKRLQGAVAPNR